MADGRLSQRWVGVVGTGEVGRRLAGRFLCCSHYVMIGSRNPDKPELHEWLTGEGAGVRSGTFAESAAHSELLLLAVLGNAGSRRSSR